MATKKNNNKSGVFTTAELAVRRGGGNGGHYNAKTRRLTLAKTVLAAVGDEREVYVVFGRNRSATVSATAIANGVSRRVHSIQCFVTVPAIVAKAWGDTGEVAIEYRLATAKKTAKKNSKKTAKTEIAKTETAKTETATATK